MNKTYKVSFRKLQNGVVRATTSGSMHETFYDAHEKVIRHCEYCGRPMSSSDVNDYGSLCESCYNKEYGHNN